MKSESNHLLQKVTLEIGLASQDGAFEIQNRISNAFQSGILRELEVLFDNTATSDQVISIDKIEIDLGRLNVSRLEEELATAVEEKMSNFLVALQNEIRNTSNSTSSRRHSLQVSCPLPGDAHFQVDVNITDTGLSLLEKITHLLEYGILPTGIIDSSSKRLTELIVPVLSEQSEQFIQYLRKNASNINVLKRLALNLTKAQLQYLCALLGCPFSANLPKLIEDFSHFLYDSNVSTSDFRKHGPTPLGNIPDQIWLSVIKHYALRDDQKSWNANKTIGDQGILIARMMLGESGVLEKVLLHLFSRSRSNKKVVRADKKTLRKLPESIAAALDLIVDSLPTTISGRIQQQRSGKVKINDADLTALVARLQLLPNLIKGETEVVTGKQDVPAFEFNETLTEQPPQLETGVYVNNAGLIILTPYLKPFFGNLGLLEGKKFKDPDSAIKGIHLLQYMCGFALQNAPLEFGEHDLLFNKILCGVDITEVVPENVVLTPEEKEECTGLLQAILNNWSIMKNSSIRALQITFFQKQGRLKKVGMNWDLIIERDSAVEILIDKLPWSISMTKLPWNDFTIHSQW